MAVAAPELYNGVAHCVLQTARYEGVAGLTKGLGASLAGIIPFSAVDLALFNTLKVWRAPLHLPCASPPTVRVSSHRALLLPPALLAR